MLRLKGHKVETISAEQVRALCRELARAADALNSVRDSAAKLAASMDVFGRNAHLALEAARAIPQPKP